MAILVDWVKQAVSGTPGTGVITLGSAVSGYIRFQDDTRISDGSTVYYTIEDGANRERGIGTYASAGTTLTRTAIHAKIESGTYSENPGTGLTLTSAAIVSCSAIADTHNFRGCILGKSAVQSVSTSTFTPVTWDSELVDTDNFHDNATNNSRITIPSGVSIVNITTSITCLIGDGKRCILRLYINGSAYSPQVSNTFWKSTAAGQSDMTFNTGDIQVSSGDYLEIVVYQDNGTSVDFPSAAGDARLSMRVIE